MNEFQSTEGVACLAYLSGELHNSAPIFSSGIPEVGDDKFLEVWRLANNLPEGPVSQRILVTEPKHLEFLQTALRIDEPTTVIDDLIEDVG